MRFERGYDHQQGVLELQAARPTLNQRRADQTLPDDRMAAFQVLGTLKLSGAPSPADDPGHNLIEVDWVDHDRRQCHP